MSQKELSFDDNPAALRAIKAATTFYPKDDVTFITGEPGSGKTEILKKVVKDLEKKGKNVLICAPTGVAALNCRGVTIHSGFKIPVQKNPEKITDLPMLDGENNKRNQKVIRVLGSVDVIFIDEVSMVSALLLDMISKRMQQIKRNTKPFGGVKVVMFGDLLQLPPVIGQRESEYYYRYYDTPWFFGANTLRGFEYKTILLGKNYRQDNDPDYRNILLAIRNQKHLEMICENINKRCVATEADRQSDITTLCSTNNSCATHNNRKMKQLKGKEFSLYGDVYGDFPAKIRPVPEEITLKEGCRVILCKNIYGEEDAPIAANGEVCKVVRVDEDNDVVVLEKVSDGRVFRVEKCTWENIDYQLDQKTNKLEAVVLGTFEHFPIKIGYAITIHKSQGLTLDECIIDTGNSCFVKGLLYVALSRCKSFSGIKMGSPVSIGDMQMDEGIIGMYKQLEKLESIYDSDVEKLSQGEEKA